MKALLTGSTIFAIEGQVLRSPDGFQHPDSAWRLWAAEEWVRVFGSGATVVDVTITPVPFGHVVSGAPTYSVSNGQVVETPTTTARSVSDVKAEMRPRLESIRKREERGAITVGSRTVRLDTQEVFKLMLAKVLGSGFDNWKLKNGNFVDLSSTQVSAVVDAIAVHVQACHDNEASLSAEITAATTLSNLSAIDLESGWP